MGALFTALRAEHFVPGLPPAPPSVAQVPDTQVHWSYQQDYLQGIPTTVVTQPQFSAASLAQYVAPKVRPLALRHLMRSPI